MQWSKDQIVANDKLTVAFSLPEVYLQLATLYVLSSAGVLVAGKANLHD